MTFSGAVVGSANRRRAGATHQGVVRGEILWTIEWEVHIARHGVTAREVEEALYSRPRLVERGRDGTRLVYCGTAAGRHLLVVVAIAPDGRDLIVTARDMTGMEERVFRRTGR